MQTATIEATDWWARSRGETTANWIANYQRSVQSRQRTVLSAIVQDLGAHRVLELGCHCGPNLVRLAQDVPGLEAVGIDANAEAVEAGQQWIRTRDLADRVTLQVGRFPAMLESVASDLFEVVFSCYALAYVAPADLDATLYEMGRLATRAVILAEPFGTGDGHRAITGYSEWAHDYQAARRWVGTLADTHAMIVPIDPPVEKLTGVLVLSRGLNTP